MSEYLRLETSPGPSGTRNNTPATSPSAPSNLSSRTPSFASPSHPSPRSSFLHSRSRSEGADSRPRPNHRVKFTIGPEDSDSDDGERPTSPRLSVPPPQFPRRPSQIHYHQRFSSDENHENPLISVSPSEEKSNPFSPPISRASSPPPRTAGSPIEEEEQEQEQELQDDARESSTGEKRRAIHSAYDRAQQLASLIHHPSQYVKRKRATQAPEFQMDDLEKQLHSDHLDGYDGGAPLSRQRSTRTHEAHELVRNMTAGGLEPLSRAGPSHPLPSGQVTPHEERDPEVYADRPSQYRSGVLATLLKLYGSSGEERSQSQSSERPLSFPPPTHTPPGSASGRITPPGRTKPKWYSKSANQSSTSLANMSGKNLSATTLIPDNAPLKKSKSSGGLMQAAKKTKKPRLEDEIRITVHIAETLSRQRYLVKLCRALMKYGAPTHRLEEYMRMTARVLEIDGQFLYIPGCMIVSFDDASTHTTEVQLVRSVQGVDFGRFADVHEIYKEVVHDVIGVEEAMQRLEELMRQKPRYNVWWLILLYGCASASVGPFAFQARPIDMPISFVLGCLLGVQQHVLAPRSDLYANVFEVTAAVVTSFLSRAFGSIPYNGGRLFCYSALTQSSIALILPGFTVLCGSLELQSRNIVAGSIRMVYAIMYSLFLGFGIMIGTALYGLMDGNATSAYTCPTTPITNEYLNHFPFVLIFTLFLILINQGKWKQTPVMIIISFTGYVVNFFSSRRFAWNTQISNALGAFVIGIMGNLYSRLQHGLAAAAILPGIFVQVPSGLASSGSLVSGLTFADEIAHNSTTTADSQSSDPNMSALNARIGSNKAYGNMVFDIGYGMLQVSIAITVGLFLAALVIYPVGKRRSGLFSF